MTHELDHEVVVIFNTGAKISAKKLPNYSQGCAFLVQHEVVLQTTVSHISEVGVWIFEVNRSVTIKGT